jgi:hypothetical protein
MVSSAINTVRNVVTNIVTTVVNTVITTVKSIVNTAVNTVKNTIITITNSIQNSQTNTQDQNKVTNTQTNKVTNIQENQNTQERRSSQITDTINKITNSFVNTVNNIANTFSNTISNVANTISNTVNSISNTINNFFSTEQNTKTNQQNTKIKFLREANISNFPMNGDNSRNFQTPFMYEEGNFSQINSNEFQFDISNLNSNNSLLILGLEAGVASSCTIGLAYYLHQTQSINSFEEERKKKENSGILNRIANYFIDVGNFYYNAFTHPRESLNSIFGAISGFGKSIVYNITHPAETFNTFVNSIKEHSTEIIAGIIIGGAITATILTAGAAGVTIPPAITLAATITGSALSIHYIGRRYGSILNDVNENCGIGDGDDECRRSIDEFNERATVDTTITLGSIGVGKIIERSIIAYSNRGIEISWDSELSDTEILEAENVYDSEIKWTFYRENFRLPKDYKINEVIFVNSESIVDDYLVGDTTYAFVDPNNAKIFFNVDRFDDSIIPFKDYIVRHEFGDYKYHHGLTNMMPLDQAMEIFRESNIPINQNDVEELIANNLMGDKVAVWNNPKALEGWMSLHSEEINLINRRTEIWSILTQSDRDKILSHLAYLQAISEEQGVTEFQNIITNLITKLPKEDVDTFNKLVQFFFTIMKKGLAP